MSNYSGTGLISLAPPKLICASKDDTTSIEFLDFQESIKKINDMLDAGLYQRLSKADEDFRILALLLKAQAKVLGYLNDQYLNCRVPWDKRTNLPSHPSMIADAQKYAKFFRCSEGLKSFLDSFLGWSLLAKEEFLCCCGSSLKPRKVVLAIMLNHVLKIDVIPDRVIGDFTSLIVKQLVGVKCDDRGHLKNHYNFGKMSQVMNDLSMIFIAETSFGLRSGKLVVEPISSQKAEQFNMDEFSKRINALASEI